MLAFFFEMAKKAIVASLLAGTDRIVAGVVLPTGVAKIGSTKSLAEKEPNRTANRIRSTGTILEEGASGERESFLFLRLQGGDEKGEKQKGADAEKGSSHERCWSENVAIGSPTPHTQKGIIHPVLKE